MTLDWWKLGGWKWKEPEGENKRIQSILGIGSGDPRCTSGCAHVESGSLSGDRRSNNAQMQTLAVQRSRVASAVFDTPRRDFLTEHLAKPAFQKAVNSMDWWSWFWPGALSGPQGLE